MLMMSKTKMMQYQFPSLLMNVFKLLYFLFYFLLTP